MRVSRGFRPEGYCRSVLATRIAGRLSAVGAADHAAYLHLLEKSPAELDRLADALTVKVSSFFRDPFVFDYLSEFVLPGILAAKAAAGDPAVRVWSAGCANGEEAYSVAILLREPARGQSSPSVATIFATDVDEKALDRGREALYPESSVVNVRHGLLESSFVREGNSFRVRPAIARTVRFSTHDMLDRRTASPSDSVFGTFDLVLCRNLLIYFEPDAQEIVFEKLHRSLAPGGVLVLGRTETLTEGWRRRLCQENERAPIYRKAASRRREPGGIAP